MSDRDGAKLQLRYGEEGGEGPLLVFHPLAACLTAGLAAGLVAFTLGEMIDGASEASSHLPTPAARIAAMARGAAAANAGLGGMLGLFLGLAAGLVRGDPRRGALGGAAGLALGAAVGGLLSMGVLPVALKLRDGHAADPILIGTAIQALVWGAVAAAAGAAFGLGLGGARLAPRFALRALCGGLIATLIYAAAGAMFFPLAETDRPVAKARAARGAAHLLVALGAGVAVGLSMTGPRHRSQPWPWDDGPAKPGAS